MDYRKQSPEMCLCVCLLAFGGPSPHFLVSCYLKIGVYRNIYRKPSFSDGGQNMVHHKVFQTNQFSDCIFFLYLIGDRIERFLGERLIHPNQSSVPTGFSLKEARYRGTDMGQIFITLPLGEAGWVKWLVFCGLVVYVGQKMEEYLITQDKNHE